jgi:hypothetical protein
MTQGRDITALLRVLPGVVQIRGEAYNVFNHPSFTKVDTTAVFDQNTGLQKSATFGNLTADDQPRIMQLSGRVNF